MVRLTFFALVAVLCSTPSALAEAAADSCDASLSTSRIVDLTATIGPELVVFESKEGLGVDHRYQSSSQANGDPANVSELRFGAHTGTHVDAPRHFARTNDAGVETLSLSWLNGPAVVVDVFDAVARAVPHGQHSARDHVDDGVRRNVRGLHRGRRAVVG
jgi:kynurenine formamidase